MSRNTIDTQISNHRIRGNRRSSLLFGLLIASTMLLSDATEAQAREAVAPNAIGLCSISVPDESGNWSNADPNTRAITRANFRMKCEYNPSVEAHYFIQLFGSCYPSDCDWGEVEGRKLSGSLDGWYYFVYYQGYARRHVYARTYPQWPGWFRLYIYNDFVDPRRSDYVIDDWFR